MLHFAFSLRTLFLTNKGPLSDMFIQKYWFEKNKDIYSDTITEKLSSCEIL